MDRSGKDRLSIADSRLLNAPYLDDSTRSHSAIGNRQSAIARSPWSLLLDPVPRAGWWHMALDLALLEEAARTGVGFVRLYCWEPWCLSFGRHEPALRRYDRRRIERLGIDTVRRPTGGRAVWHARELTYSVAAPLQCFGGLMETYRAIHQTLAEAVRRLGAPAVLAPAGRPAAVSAGACFASPAGGEVLSHGRKLVGSAQLRQGTAFLQHGSLLLEDDQHVVGELSLDRVLVPDAITLSAAAGRIVSFTEAAAAVMDELREWDGMWSLDRNPDPESLVARHADRFRSPAWTWRR